MERIDLAEIVSDLETYPTWSSGKSYKVNYPALKCGAFNVN